jgi:hypothetical protein
MSKDAASIASGQFRVTCSDPDCPTTPEVVTDGLQPDRGATTAAVNAANSELDMQRNRMSENAVEGEIRDSMPQKM